MLLRRNPLRSSPLLRRRCRPSSRLAATSAMCCRLTSWARTRVSSPSRHSGCRRNIDSATTSPSTASPRNSSRSLSPASPGSSSPPTRIRSLARERWVSARSSSSGLTKSYPSAASNSLKTASNYAPGLRVEKGTGLGGSHSSSLDACNRAPRTSESLIIAAWAVHFSGSAPGFRGRRRRLVIGVIFLTTMAFHRVGRLHPALRCEARVLLPSRFSSACLYSDNAWSRLHSRSSMRPM